MGQSLFYIAKSWSIDAKSRINLGQQAE